MGIGAPMRDGKLEPPQPRPALHPRRRAAVDGDRTFQRRSLGGDRTRVVPRIRLLLERRIVLLVDDDEPEIADGREDGGTGADDDARLAARDPLALVAPLGVTERRVQNRDARRRNGQRTDPTVCGVEGDLGDEHDRAEPASERRGTGLEVDLRLAASRRAVQEYVIAAAGERRGDLLDRRELGRCQLFGLGLSREGIPRCRRPPLASPGARVRRDERERPGRCRAVVLGEPERKLDERRRNLVDDRSCRSDRDPGRRLDPDPHDDTAHPPPAERDRDDRASLDPVLDLVRERTRQRAGGDERVDLRERHRGERSGCNSAPPARSRRRISRCKVSLT